MSVRSHRHRERGVPPTDPKWYPVTRGLNRWLNKMANRRDLTVRVLKGNIGAPARYVPNAVEIDFSEALLSRVDPRISGSDEFIIKHPHLAGAGVHEACHARFSTFDLASIGKQYGKRHYDTFAMLEEARCETQNWLNLSDTERAALQTMVLTIVLKDTLPEDGSKPDFGDPRLLVRLVGLIAGRVNTGIVDITQPKAAALWSHVMDVLGDDFDTFANLAVEFSRVANVGHYSSADLDQMHDIVQRWIAAEDAAFPPPEPPTGGDDEGDEPGGGGGGGGDESDDDEQPSGGSGSGKRDESDDESDNESGSGDGDADGGDEGDESESSGGDDGDESDDDGDDSEGEGPSVGDDDEGEIGDGSNHIGDGDELGDASLGGYASSHVDSSVLEDIFNEITEAAEEAEHVGGSRLRRQSIQLTKSVAADHQRRRMLNKEAAKRWR